MSLDVMLVKKVWFSYDEGKTFEETDPEILFEKNITHNLREMADKAGIYKALWRPEEIRITKASELIPILKKGYKDLKESQEYFEEFNPKNGWGSYYYLVQFVQEYLEACKKYPNSIVIVDR